MKQSNEKHFGKKLNPIQRRLFLVAGFISLALGVVGIPLPLLPTTPFLLLAAWLFARSSERFYIWLMNHRLFGEVIRNYRDKGGVRLKVKVFAVVLLWLTIGLSACLAVDSLWIRLLLLIIAVGVTIHIISLKTVG